MSRDPRLAAMQRDLADSLSPRYELIRLLGSGAMGAVFLCREPALERLVAVKILGPEVAEDPDARAWFHREGRAAAALSHPNAIRVYTVGETREQSLPYMVMQYVEGRSLATRIREEGRAEERVARRIIGEVAAALAAAHARDLVHRDIKPANILLEAETGRAYLTDFGLTVAIARSGSASTDGPGPGAGTPAFMSPEQAAGRPAGLASDVYSLGLVAYELLSGRLPFDERTAIAWRAAHIHDDAEPIRRHRPDISPEVGRLLQRCLAKDPSERPAAAEVSDVLLPGLLNEVVWPPPGLQGLRGTGRRLARLLSATGAVAAVLVLLLAWPPTAARADRDWWRVYAEESTVAGSTLGVRAERQEEPSIRAAFTVWRWTLRGGTVLLLLGTVAVAFVGARTFARQLHARDAGWHRDSLADVSADPDGRSGLLLTGSRELASLEPAQRERARRARRRQVAAALGGGAWLVVVPGLYAFTVAAGLVPSDGAGPIVPPWLAAVALGPALLAMAIVAWAWREEAGAMGELPTRHPYAPALAGPAEAPGRQQTLEWYAALPEPREPAPAPGRSRSRWISASGAGAGLLAVGGGGMALLVVASLVAAGSGERLGAPTAELERLVELADRASPLERARPGWRGVLGRAHGVSADEPGASGGGHQAREEGQSALRGLLDPAAPAAPRPYPPELTAVLRDAGGRVDSLIVRAAELPGSLLQAAALVAEHPRTSTLQRLAGVDELDLITAAGGGSEAFASLDALPEPAYGRLREAAVANALGAVHAVARGDTSAAVTRLLENAAFAYRLAEDPRLFVTRYAVGMLQNLAVLPLAGVEALRGDTIAAGELRDGMDRLRELTFHPAWVTGVAGLASNPERLASWEAIVADSSLVPGLRVAGLGGAWEGFCVNPRELLGGLDERRSAAARRVGRTIRTTLATDIASLVETTWWNRLEEHGGPWPYVALRYCVG